MKFNKKKISFFLIFLAFLLLCVSIKTASNIMNLSSNHQIKEKIHYEIVYICKQLTEMFTESNNSSFVNWKKLQDSTNTLYHYWNSSILDLNTLELDKTLLVEFGEKMNDLSISIKNQDKETVKENILLLYHTCVVLSENVSDMNTNYLMNVKYYVMNANTIAVNGNWTVVRENILKGDEYLSKIVYNLINQEYNQYNLNQAYVALKELENTISTQDLELFDWKYTIVMEKLNQL